MRPNQEDLSETHEDTAGVRDPGGQFDLDTFGSKSRGRKLFYTFTHFVLVHRYSRKYKTHSRLPVDHRHENNRHFGKRLRCQRRAKLALHLAFREPYHT